MSENQEVTVREAGRRGGNATKAKYGHDFYSRNGQKGGKTTAEKYDRDFYRKAGGRGGSATLQKYGRDYYVEISRKAHHQQSTDDARQDAGNRDDEEA